jgi:hypothetical protein
VRNPRASWSLLTAVLALAVMVGAAAAASVSADVDLWEIVAGVPVGGLLALVALSLARRARWEHQRTLGRAGGAATAALARFIATLALLVAVTAALALVVFAVLTFASD